MLEKHLSIHSTRACFRVSTVNSTYNLAWNDDTTQSARALAIPWIWNTKNGLEMDWRQKEPFLRGLPFTILNLDAQFSNFLKFLKKLVHFDLPLLLQPKVFGQFLI